MTTCATGKGVFEAVSLFAIRATPSRDFSDTLSRCELHGEKLLKYLWRVGMNNIHKNGWMDDNGFGKYSDCVD